MTPEEDGSSNIDHVVIAVADLGLAADEWRRAGFTVAPMGRHSAAMGTVNHTIMFDRDYIELLAVETATPLNEDWRSALAEAGPGLHGIALATGDGDALVRRWNAAGVQAGPVISFERPVPRPDGDAALARFRVVNAAAGTIPGLKLFACQHLTRDAVWFPDLTRHANTARGLVGVEMSVPDAEAAARAWKRLGASETERSPDGVSLRLDRHRLRLLARRDAPARVTGLWLEVARLGACAEALSLPASSGSGILRSRAIGGMELVFAETPDALDEGGDR